VRVGERVLELQEALEEQSERAQRGLGPANSASDPLTGCPTDRRVLSREHFRGIESCPRQHCEPGNCCSSRHEADPLEQPLLTNAVAKRITPCGSALAGTNARALPLTAFEDSPPHVVSALFA
jgi:hypothetical protein